MLLCISDKVFVCSEYPSKHVKLHRSLDYIVYLRYCIEFNCIAVVLKVQISV